ncbi:hypothetical protein CPC08DRAFT_706369 [Agrocybe pediades]|nr:hypothetical protein CPC08DRAFT_706369 [Agrocybe pediades]
MPEMSLEEYYAEQDERLNRADESMDDYVKRVSRKKNPMPASSVQQHSAALEVRQEQSSLTIPSILGRNATTSTTTEIGRATKRKAAEAEADALGPVRRQKIDPEYGLSHTVDNHLPESTPSTHSRKDSSHPMSPDTRASPKDERNVSPALDDIEPFTIDEIDVPVSASTSHNKRKDIHVGRSTRQLAQDKRRLRQVRSPQAPAASTSELSPILSFSNKSYRNSSHSPKRAPLDLGPPKRRRLDLPPAVNVHKATENQKNTDLPAVEPPLSPIEDVSLEESSTKKPLVNQSSSLFLSIQERIAKHSSGAKTDKVLKLSKKRALPEPSLNEVAVDLGNKSSSMCVSSSPSSNPQSPPPQKKTKTSKDNQEPEPKISAAKGAKLATEQRKGKGKKEKPAPITAADFARKLKVEFEEAAKASGKKHRRSKFLEGKNVFFSGGDWNYASESTRKKMTIIMQCGANLMPEYDPEVTTHIITCAPSVGAMLQDLKLKSLKQIPRRIPTVTWDWVLTVLDDHRLDRQEIDTRLENAVIECTPYAERLDLYKFESYKPRPRASRSVSANSEEGRTGENVSRPINAAASSSSESNDERRAAHDVRHSAAPISPPISPTRRASNSTASTRQDCKKSIDPLAEFYDQARRQKEVEDGWSSIGDVGDSDSDETDDEPDFQPVARAKKGWTCDNKQAQMSGDCPNEDIINKLNELMELHKVKGGSEDRWRVVSYSKTIRALRNHPTRIRSGNEARRLPGVGEKTAQKIEEIITTGDLQRIKYENTNDVEVIRLFQGIYGVGRSIAFKWYQAGCHTLEDLRARKGGVTLTVPQAIGLKYYDDINTRMPREEARAIFELIKPKALAIDPKLSVQIMGSYRRGKADCGDIDILITRPTDDGETHAGVLPRLLRELHASDILTEDLALPEDPEDLEATYRGLCHLPKVEGSRQRRIDFLTVPWTSRGAALLYYTGDDIFNRAIRLKANVMGYALNQKGLFKNVIRDPRDRRIKLDSGVLIASETEEEIFKILNVPWQEPHERVRG